MQKASKQLLAISTVLGLGLVISTTPASATITSNPKPDNTAKTQATVTLKQSEQDGAIRIEQAPNYEFNNLEISAFTKEYGATSVKNNLVVSNPGFESGYHVTAKISAFTKADVARKGDAGAAKLTGADLFLTNGTVSAVEAENPSAVPLTTNNIHLTGTDNLMLNATAGTALGRHQLVHDKSAVRLRIPAGNKVGAYNATIVWTLNNTPA